MESTKVIKVKWNQNVFDIEMSSIQNINQLKMKLNTLTNVLINEQKLIFKSRVLQDTFDLNTIAPNSIISMIGAASVKTIPGTNQEKVTFVEDLTQAQKLQILREKGEDVAFGLRNLGNTCYLNSVVQCIGRIPELRERLKKVALSPSNNTQDLAYLLTVSLGMTYNSLDKATEAVIPNLLVPVVKKINPLFAETDNGIPKQQDADECVSLFLTSMHGCLKNTNQDKYSENFIEELFGIEMNIKLKNIEAHSETKVKKELVYKLICYIDNTTIELVEGLKKSLLENVDMFSDVLGRNTVFEKSQYINRLPSYLSIQFMRFFWKQANEMTGAKAGKAKILKSVLFSKIIDVYDLCTDETKELLNLGRKIETKMLKDDKNFKIDQIKREEGKDMIPTGRYQLISVITHQGRSSDSGHYIGWVHRKDDKWLKYDDDVVSMVTTNDVMELKGGGDWHMAYICFFKMLEVPFMEVND